MTHETLAILTIVAFYMIISMAALIILIVKILKKETDVYSKNDMIDFAHYAQVHGHIEMTSYDVDNFRKV